MSLISSNNIAKLVGIALSVAALTSCKKDNIEYNTFYKWEKFGNVEYYFNEYDEAHTNLFGLKLPNVKGRMYIYDLNNNLRFDRDESSVDYMLVNDSVQMGDKKVDLIVDAIYAYEKDEKTAYVDSLMNKYLPMLRDSLASKSQNKSLNIKK